MKESTGNARKETAYRAYGEQMDRNMVGRVRNICIIVLFAAVVLYSAFYWARTPGEEAAGEQAVIEGEVAKQTAQPGADEAGQALDGEDGGEETVISPERFCDILAVVKSAEGTQNIKLYIQNDACYFFLPAYARPEETTWQYDEGKYTIICDGRAVRNGERLALPEQGEAVLEIGQSGSGDEEECQEYRFCVMQSANLPALYIRTDAGALPGAGKTEGDETPQEQVIGDEDLQRNGESHAVKGSFLCIAETGAADSAGTISRIADRAYADFHAPKKNSEMDFDKPQDVLGMGSDTRWMLQANAYDMSRLRNKTVYDMAADMGLPYGVRSAYVDIWLNGEYAGNYLVCRQDGDGQAVCLLNGAEGYETRLPDNTAQEEQDATCAYVDAILERIERCDSEEDYRRLGEMFDIDSFACLYVLYGLSNEPALNRTNLCYLVPGGTGSKLYAGLDMDFDRSLGNAQEAHYERLTCFVPGLGEKLFACEYFRQDVKERFAGQYGPVAEKQFQEEMENKSGQIQASVLMDDVRWGLPDSRHYEDFNQGYENSGDAAKYAAHYLNVRYAFMQAYLDAPEQWRQVEYVNSASKGKYDSRRYYVLTGEKVPDEVSDFLQEMFGCVGWRYEDSRGCETGRPVYQDMRIVSDVEEGTQQGAFGEEIQNQGTEEAGQGQSAGNGGYSKRFVVLCMLFAAGCAGLCGVVFGGAASWLFFRKKG